jgi:hypothetical protein
MTKQLYDSRQANPLLTQIYEGMRVYDRRAGKIGTVEYVYLGDLTEADDEHGERLWTPSIFGSHERSLIEEFARDVALADTIPDPLREQLLRHGFIRISSAGLFTADRYAKPAHIASVSDDGVTLRVTRDELIKR